MTGDKFYYTGGRYRQVSLYLRTQWFYNWAVILLPSVIGCQNYTVVLHTISFDIVES